MNGVILGVDGGGTHSKIVAADLSGNILARCEFENLNYNNESVEICRERLLAAVRQVLKQAGRADYDFMCIGLSALQEKASPEEKQHFLGDAFDSERVYLNSDIYMALTAASLWKPEIMIVSGTGAMCIGRDKNGNLFTRGGYGYMVDNDRGSSYYIALNGVIAAIDAVEGYGKGTALTEAMLKRFDIKRVEDIIYTLYMPGYHISRGAQFAQDVIELAKQGDLVAAEIVERNVDYLVRYATDVAKMVNERDCGVSVYGGLFQYNPHIREMFTRKLKEKLPDVRVRLLSRPAEIGALIEYFLQNGLLTQTVLENLGKNGKEL